MYNILQYYYIPVFDHEVLRLRIRERVETSRTIRSSGTTIKSVFPKNHSN